MGSANDPTLSQMKAVINHVFLPPKLPQSSDELAAEHDNTLLELAHRALFNFRSYAADCDKTAIVTAAKAIQCLQYIRISDGSIDSSLLLKTLRNLSEGDYLPIIVSAQNAAILVSRNHESFIFEFFELTPGNHAVMSNQGRLKRQFPGSAVTVPLKNVVNGDFFSGLAKTIAKMSYQEVPEMKPTAIKARQHQIEERETTNPAIVTELLCDTLRAFGIDNKIDSIQKNTRDEVLWKDARLPWRRSPLWLLIRVTLQIIMSRHTESPTAYKQFMIYFMALVVQWSEPLSISSDILYCMVAKISGRFLKLGRDDSYVWMLSVDKILARTISCLDDRWQSIIRESSPVQAVPKISAAWLHRDKSAAFPQLDSFIESIGARKPLASEHKFEPDWSVEPWSESCLPTLSHCPSQEEEEFFLLNFEYWVALHLEAWLQNNITDASAPSQLSQLIESYHCRASTRYQDSPESTSLMLLTIFELWIACDKSACQQHPLMLKYDHELPFELLQSLILPSKLQMMRLNRVESYLESRRNKANRQNRSSMISDFGTENSFGSRFFDTSKAHQDLMASIKEAAEREKQEKTKEFKRLREQYEELMRKHRKASHEYVEKINKRTGASYRKHIRNCDCCAYLQTAQNLSIEVHEWPLPSNKHAARNVVFELIVPDAISAWRNCTAFLLSNVLGSRYAASDKHNTQDFLHSYLSVYYRSGHHARFKLVSTTKSNRRTHRKIQNLSTASISQVLLNNGLQLHYYDTNASTWAARFQTTDAISHQCTYKITQQNAILQKFLMCRHDQCRPYQKYCMSLNHTISLQSSCPENLSLEEFRAMAALPLGFRIQWSNILTQVLMPAVDFRKADTLHIILQACRQTGPPSSSAVERAGHCQPTDPAFARVLLEGLTASLERVKENWESFYALEVFTKLATRVLTLTTTDAVATAYLKFVTDCRAVAHEWLIRLQDKVKHLETDAERTEFRGIIFQIAQICLVSFDVDSHHLQLVLAEPSQAEILIISSIVARNTMQNISPNQKRIATLRMCQILYNSLQILRQEITHKANPCLDRALCKSWAAYPGEGLWKPVAAPHQHWLTTKVSATDQHECYTIHYNALTGELLVNGLPISQLPAEFSNHETYGMLFGNTTLEAVQTSLPGMKFSTKESYNGYAVYLGLGKSEGDFLVAASISGRMHHLVPCRVFKNFLPDRFADQYCHWYDKELDEIEFRDKQSPWLSPTKEQWRLKRDNLGWFLVRQDGQVLIAPTTETARCVAKTLSPLESILHLHVVIDTAMERLTIELPRLQLDFFSRVESDQMISRQFRDMYVDDVQEIGSLIGLKSKLVLRDDNSRRKVLLLDGCPNWSRNDKQTHVHVSINHGTSKRVFSYEVDKTLGRLVDNGSLQSKLQVCYLHALTSFCRPDPLTGKTGTEQALSILNSASVRSFDYLSEENVKILESIAQLAPARQFYPREIQSMETICWDTELSFLSQSQALYEAVKSILDQESVTSFFYPGISIVLPRKNHIDSGLATRHMIRMSSFQVSGFGAEKFSSKLDVSYNSRDKPRGLARTSRVLDISYMLYRDESKLVESLDSGIVARLQSFFQGDIAGPLGNLGTADICYDLLWLGDQTKVLHENWCELHRVLAQEKALLLHFDTIMCFSAMAYSISCNFQILQALATVVKFDKVRNVKIPSASQFLTREGCTVDRRAITVIATENQHPFFICPESSLEQQDGETLDELNERRHAAFMANQENATYSFVTAICKQWRCASPTGIHEGGVYLSTCDAMDAVEKKWEIWYDNYLFDEYIQLLVKKMKKLGVEQTLPNKGVTTVHSIYPRTVSKPILTWRNVFVGQDPELPDMSESKLDFGASSSQQVQVGARLSHLLEQLGRLSSNEHISERNYVKELENSLTSLKKHNSTRVVIAKDCEIRRLLEKNLNQCEAHLSDVWAAICKTIDANLRAAVNLWSHKEVECCKLIAGFMAPRLSASLLLEHLARRKWEVLPMPWRRTIVAYALAITSVQRAKRMLNVSNNHTELAKELMNPGHGNWDPLENPESLLLEVESGILIRDVQAEIATRMRSPPGGNNAVMQLNMGEGKSSVIVPIVASHLGDGTKLVRVVVAKPQAKELFRTLVSKLGGLLNRRVYHMPFSRALRPTSDQIQKIHEHYKECKAQGGVLLLQPEHILSFELMGIESQTEEALEMTGRAIFDVQHFFNLYSRDIVDESDENFSPKFELIYTMGEQSPIELNPDRWLAAQEVLKIIASIAPKIKKDFPESISLSSDRPGNFPRLRILRSDAEIDLFHAVARHICDVGFPGLPIARQSDTMRDALFKYIVEEEPCADTISLVEQSRTIFTDSTKGLLLILRGLLAGRVLSFVFSQKRWRVNYGLDSSRRPKTRLAVPYRAKDSPTPRSEFSHPDVVIQLTCLSYYYGGLSDDELFATLEHLINSDQADGKYDELVVDAPSLPACFRRLVGINIRDTQQLKNRVFPCLRFGKRVVDYFLAELVFSKEMKEFSHKLSVSGWDLGKQKPNPTTGFSGTNDSQHVLPLEINQLDLEDQRHTNALVLEHLLGDENTVKMLPPMDAGDQTSDAGRLLAAVTSSECEIQVLLDVGAQILELTNVEVAKQWLRLLPSGQKKEAVVYFNDFDELCVIDGKGQIEDLRTSPYADQLDLCLVFLDESHTRGTDLKLPDHYRAAVTLGPNLTKDRLVQACMRMRKLGKGQSVVFFVSPEMRCRINTSNKNRHDCDITTEDVLMWSISETHSDLRRLMPLWAMQGVRFERQRQLWQKSTCPDGIKMSREQAEAFLEEEAQTIELRYRPSVNTDADKTYSPFDAPSNKNGSLHNAAIQQRCEDFGIHQFRSAALQEEQEKELSPEIEQERSIERPAPATALPHCLHQDVRSFVESGNLKPSSEAFQEAFLSLNNTSAKALANLKQFPAGLLVTQEYVRTVKLGKKDAFADSYQRPIQWILSVADRQDIVQKLVIISPYEADELVTKFESWSSNVYLHIYSPRTNLAFDALDSLRLYTVPPLGKNWTLPSHLRLQLNLFAGQLYFGSFGDYRETCEMLGLAWKPPVEGELVEADGFIIRQGRRSSHDTRLQKSPVPCLKVILQTLRRDCQEINRTHWGKMFAGELLTEKDFAAVTENVTEKKEMVLVDRTKQ